MQIEGVRYELKSATENIPPSFSLYMMTPNQLYYAISLFGFILSQIFCILFSGKYEGDKPEQSLILNLPSLSIHIHHWISGLAILVGVIILEQSIGRVSWLAFFKGVAIGLIFHGLAFYIDYFQIIKIR